MSHTTRHTHNSCHLRRQQLCNSPVVPGAGSSRKDQIGVIGVGDEIGLSLELTLNFRIVLIWDQRRTAQRKKGITTPCLNEPRTLPSAFRSKQQKKKTRGSEKRIIYPSPVGPGKQKIVLYHVKHTVEENKKLATQETKGRKGGIWYLMRFGDDHGPNCLSVLSLVDLPLSLPKACFLPSPIILILIPHCRQQKKKKSSPAPNYNRIEK